MMDDGNSNNNTPKDPALDEPDAMAIVHRGQTIAPVVTNERKQQLLIQARAERRKWVQKVPLPYASARDPNNVWSSEDRLYPVHSSVACKRLPTATKVLSELYGLETHTRTPEDVAQRVEGLVRPFINDDSILLEGRDEGQLEQIISEDGSLVVKVYHEFWTTLMKPECALLIQGMRNFLGNMDGASMDRLSGAMKSYIDSTFESLKTHQAWKNKQEIDFILVKRSFESFLFGQAHGLLEKLEWTGLFRIEEAEWNERLGKLQFVQPLHLEIECLSDQSLPIDDLLKEPIEALLSIDRYYSPYEKLQRILAVYQGVNAALSTALNLNKETERKLPSADDVLPTIILIVLRGKPTHMFRNLHQIEVFAPQEYLRGEAGYAYTNLYGAVQFLQDLDMDKPGSLAISPEDFRKGLEESVRDAQKRFSVVQGETDDADQSPLMSADINARDVREARLRGETIDLEWAINHQKEHPEKYNMDDKERETMITPLPEGFTRSYAFMSSTAQDIRLSDLPKLLSEYKMMVRVTEQLLGERGARMALEKKKRDIERNQQLDDTFFGVMSSGNARERTMTS